MKPVLVIPALLLLLLAGCATQDRDAGSEIQVPTSSSALLPPKAVPRGSPDFCRSYGQQTANNEFRSARNSRGGGPSGFEAFRARDVGERAAARCRTGRLN